MEVQKSYVKFLLQLLKSDELIEIDEYREELMVNLYLTLLSLSSLKYSDGLENKENEIISDFLRKLNNLKVKIQLKRKKEEIDKLSSELITEYYENINILSIYFKDGKELEKIINSKDSREITKLVDIVTKDKMNKDDNKERFDNLRLELLEILPDSNYYISDNKIFIKNKDKELELSIKEFTSIFSYLLIPSNYNKLYTNKNNQKSHDLIISNIIKFLVVKDKKDLDKVLIPTIITYILSLNIDNKYELDTSSFNIENIKITELYSLAQNGNTLELENTPKWRNISIPNEYLIDKLKYLIKRGMYYYKEDKFILENIENKVSDFRVSINEDKIKVFLMKLLEANI